jgi:hypothetical protein
MSEASKTTLD